MAGERRARPQRLPGPAGEEGGDCAAGPGDQPPPRGAAAPHVQEDQHRRLPDRGPPRDSGISRQYRGGEIISLLY